MLLLVDFLIEVNQRLVNVAPLNKLFRFLLIIDLFYYFPGGSSWKSDVYMEYQKANQR